VGLRHDTATRRLVDAFHQEGLLVFVYTADRPRDIRRAVSLGVDGVISNFPERITRAQGLAPSEPSSTSGGEKVDTL
jgi:glycerophosphoryl diester phosphodiesterase